MGISNQHPIRDRFKDSPRPARLNLLLAKHAAQMFGLVADQVEQFGIVQGDPNLAGSGFHQ